MGYYSDDITDKELKKLEKQIAGVYREAYAEMRTEADKYFKTLEARYDKEYQAYQEGKYTDEEFQRWYRTQVERGNGYQKMASELASRATNANMVASSYINDKTPSIYSLNYSYETYEIQMGSGVIYHAYDEQTIRNLLKGDENVVEFRTTSVSPNRDYEWNKQQIERAVTSGILQGKSIDKLSESFLTVMKRNKASAVRNARTSFTSAQNAGRQMGYNQAKSMGLDFEKEWIATLDERTRISHGLLDGKRVPCDKTFSNGLMYPADSSGAPAEVYNCRCTMRAIFKNVNDEPRQTYTEWIKSQSYADEGNMIAYEGDMKKLSSKAKKIIEEKDVTKQMNLIHNLVGEYVNTSSKWNGTIKIDDNLKAYALYSSVNNTITVRSDTPIKSKVHDMLHSYSNNDLDTNASDFIKHKKVEEGAVEFLAQQICIDNGIEFKGTRKSVVDGIIKIADANGMNHMIFAKKLFDIPASQRYEYLDKLAKESGL